MIDIESLKSIPVSTASYKLIKAGVVQDMVVVKPSSRIHIENVYDKASLKGTNKNVYLRLNVIQKLEKILNQLPSKFSIIIFDGFRSLETQKAIFNEFFEKILAEGGSQKSRPIKRPWRLYHIRGKPDVMR